MDFFFPAMRNSSALDTTLMISLLALGLGFVVTETSSWNFGISWNINICVRLNSGIWLIRRSVFLLYHRRKRVAIWVAFVFLIHSFSLFESVFLPTELLFMLFYWFLFSSLNCCRRKSQVISSFWNTPVGLSQILQTPCHGYSNWDCIFPPCWC